MIGPGMGTVERLGYLARSGRRCPRCENIVVTKRDACEEAVGSPLKNGRSHMARIMQNVGHSQSQSSPLQGSPVPDYEAEADRGRLKLGGDELARRAFDRN